MLAVMRPDDARPVAERRGRIQPGAGRLIRHDGMILAKGFAAAFSSWRDRALLLVMLLLAGLWLRDAAARGQAFHDTRIAICLGAVAGWAVARGLRQRLAYHAEEGVLAAHASEAAARRGYLSLFTTIFALPLFGLAALVLAERLPPLAIGFAAAASAALLLPAGLSPRLPARSLRIFGFGPVPGARIGAMAAAAGLAAASLLAGGVGWALKGEAGAAVLLAGAALLSFFGLARVDAPTCRFLALAGHGPLRSAALNLAPALLFALLTAAPAFALFGGKVFAILSLPLFGLIGIATARIWLYQVHARRTADWVLTFALAAAALVATAAPPLAFLLLLLMGADLYRRARRVRWRLG